MLRFEVLRFSNLEPRTSNRKTAKGSSFGEGSRCCGSRCCGSPTSNLERRTDAPPVSYHSQATETMVGAGAVQGCCGSRCGGSRRSVLDLAPQRGTETTEVRPPAPGAAEDARAPIQVPPDRLDRKSEVGRGRAVTRGRGRQAMTRQPHQMVRRSGSGRSYSTGS